MKIVSTGFRTDLAILELGGSTVEDLGTHLVVRTPDNPGYHWGNFVLLVQPPLPGAAREIVDVFDAEFPEADHVAIGIDGNESPGETVAEFAACEDLDLTVADDAVMAAAELQAPERPAEGAELRPLASDEDWDQLIALEESLNGGEHPAEPHRRFVTARARTQRGLVEAGHATWWGAFEDARLLAGLGLVALAGGIGRYQSVGTRPEARGRGLATSLVHHAGATALADGRIETLVIVADPDDQAFRLYQRLGFLVVERQTQVHGS